MAFLGTTFDPNTVAPSQDFQPLPSGEYPAIITDSEMRPTKRGDGQYLELTFQIIDGPMKGRLVWSRLNLENPNQKAVEIAQRDLSAICHAVGITRAITDSQQLHNLPMMIRVEFIPAGTKGSDRDSNEVKAYKRLEGAPAPAAQPSPFAAPPAAQSSAAAPAAAPSAPAWARPAA